MIGGFEGMLISLMGVGLFTLPLLLIMVGKRPLGRKSIFAIAVLIPLAVFAYTGLDKFNDTVFVVAVKDEKLDPDF